MIDRNKYSPLLLIIGQYANTGSNESIDLIAKEQRKMLININLELSKYLLDSISPPYFSKLKSCLQNLINEKQSTYFVYPEILFDPGLKIEAFNFLREIAKVQPVTVAIQNAAVIKNKVNNANEKLVYGSPYHAEYTEMKSQDLRDVSIIEPKKFYKWEDSSEIS
jgi:hypothetical protein